MLERETHAASGDGLRLLETRSADGSLKARFAHGLARIEGIGSCVEAYVASSAKRYYMLYDHRGSAHVLLDESKVVVATRLFNAFGETVSETGTWPDEVPFGYQSNWLTLPGTNYGLSPTRIYDAETGRFLQRDRLWEAYAFSRVAIIATYKILGKAIRVLSLSALRTTAVGTLYTYTGGRVVGGVDPSGLKEIVINIYYNWTESDPNQDVQDELDRILQNCLDKCVGKCPDGTPKHSVTVNWIATEARTAEELKEQDKVTLGWQGRSWGFNPTGVNVLSTDNLMGKDTGYQNDTWAFQTNPDAIAFYAGQNLDEGIAETVAHEMLHHTIGGAWGHYWRDEGYVDAKKGKIGGELSKDACDELCDELDIGGTDYFA